MDGVRPPRKVEPKTLPGGGMRYSPVHTHTQSLGDLHYRPDVGSIGTRENVGQA